ncbi:MAG: hypothetical protein LBG09_03785 [Puniceicoccales bacterium]|jgi:hypothetical protein|nr:hypothetical protein [Puniceicoccales bacterium]
METFLMSVLDEENWQVLDKNVFGNPIFKWLIGVGVVFFALYFYRKRCANRIRVCTTDRGPIFLKKSALKNAVKKICHKILPQSKTRVKVCSCFGKIRLKISIVCPYNIQPISVQLQDEIIRILKQEIGINNLGPVRVVVDKITGPIQVSSINMPFSPALDCESPANPDDYCPTKNADHNENFCFEQPNDEQQNGK